MGITLSVQNAWNYTTAMIDNQRLDVNNLEPGVTMANTVLQTMLSPPFRWRQNRRNTSIALTNAGGTDYVKALSDFGWIETQWLTDSTGRNLELNGDISLPKISQTRVPTKISPQYDDNQGNITFRINSVPDVNYTAFIDYQAAAPYIENPAATFSPFSDYFGYLFQKGFLSEGALLVNDSRFTVWRAEWIAQMLATQDGLTEQEKNIFFEQFMNRNQQAIRGNTTAQTAVQQRAR